jgi:hypothetical protein
MITFVQNRKEMSYYTNIEIREQIDNVLRANANIFANLGQGSSKTEVERAKIMERKNLRQVRNLDMTFVDALLSACD